MNQRQLQFIKHFHFSFCELKLKPKKKIERNEIIMRTSVHRYSHVKH